MAAYYNEIDPYAAEWLRNLIMLGHIADGVVDTRSISEIQPNELREFTQCHFFAGIGVWSHALRTAGWPDDRPVWTGSCPCQPFSSAGRAGGFTDERHLWPHWQHLIRECRPGVVFGEQVASKDGLAWLDLVHTDMEGEGYAFSAIDLCAAGVGAPHIRQRLYFVADTVHAGRPEGRTRAGHGPTAWCGSVEQLVYANHAGLEGYRELGWVDGESGRQAASRQCAEAGEPCGVEHAELQHERPTERQSKGAWYTAGAGKAVRPTPTSHHWRDADWLFCRDGKWRPVEPGTFPLAHGATARVGRLRAYGNAIVAQVAAEVIGAYLDVRGSNL